MTEETPDPKTADLAEIVVGRTFPTTKVPIIFDEDAQYKLNLLDKALSGLPFIDTTDEIAEQRAELTAKREELLDELKSKTYVLHLTGVYSRLKDDLLKSIGERFPAEYETNFIGVKTMKENPEADRTYAQERLALHIVKLEFPDGRINTDAPSVSQFLFENAPETSVFAAQIAIQELESGVKSGYEAAVQDLDF